jgi:23S rRNA pseudouridine955/2504/2580 synthase
MGLLLYFAPFHSIRPPVSSSQANSVSSPSSSVRIVEVSEHQEGQRLDNFLVSRLKGAPKSLIYKIIRKGEVRINGGRAKPESRLVPGDKVRIPPVRLAETAAPAAPGASLAALLKGAILFEDEHLMVLNKPAGLAVHAGTGAATGLIEAMRALYPQYPALELVHRLDKGTSGCLLLAKTGKARKAAMAAFRQHEVSKIYHVIVKGHWPPTLQVVTQALRRMPERNGERRVTADDSGKASETRFRILGTFPDATLLEARPLTGRTHQIRVHAAESGHPVLGDDKYAEGRHKGINRLCLHAASLELPHPVTGATLQVKAGYDAAWQAIVKLLQAAG